MEKFQNENLLDQKYFEQPTLISQNDKVYDIQKSQVIENQLKIKKNTLQKNQKASKYFLQITRENLLFFLSAGIIFPKQYCEQFKYNFTSNDLYSQIEDKILFSQKYCNDFTDNILVETILDSCNYETFRIENGNEVLLIQGLIPVSRIKNIYFKSEEFKNKFINSIYENSPIYENLCIVNSKYYSDFNSLSSIEVIKGQITKQENKLLSKQINNFLSILGMMKLMSISDYLSWPFKKSFIFPSLEFLFFLSILNESLFKNENLKNILSEHKKEDANICKIFMNHQDKVINNTNEFILNFIIEKIDLGQRFEKELISELKKSIDGYLKVNKLPQDELIILSTIFSDLEKWAAGEPGVTYDKLTEKENFSNIWSSLLLLTLIKFSNKEKIKEIFGPLKTLQRVAKNHNTICYVLAGIGRYFGYMNLLNDIVFEQEEKIIEKEIGNKIIVKPMELNLLERYLIETIYNYTCEEKLLFNEFIFLKEIYLEKPNTEETKQKGAPIRKEDFIMENRSFNILNSTIISLIIKNRVENIKDLIQKYYPEEISISESMLTLLLIYKYDLIFYRGSKNRKIVIKKNLLFEMEKDPQKFKTYISEIEDTFEFDKKYGFIK